MARKGGASAHKSWALPFNYKLEEVFELKEKQKQLFEKHPPRNHDPAPGTMHQFVLIRIFKDSYLYCGEVSEGNRVGPAFCQNFETKDLFDMVFAENHPQPNVKIYFANGNYYEGTFDGQGMLNGTLEIDEEESKYTGDFKNNLPHGIGEKVFRDGTTLKGRWDMGQFCRELSKDRTRISSIA